MMIKKYSRYEKQITFDRDETVSTMRRRNANGRTILIGLILAILLISMGVFPVMAYQVNRGPPTPISPLLFNGPTKPYDNAPVFNYSSLSPEKLKITPDLLYILYPDIIAMNLSSKDPVVNLQNAKGNLQYQNLYKPGNGTIKNGVTIQSSPDLVLVEITMRPGNSTYILDPYINELYGRSERSHKVEAWVEVPNIEKIALMPEVRWIDTVQWGVN